jgi:hypothetical protein
LKPGEGGKYPPFYEGIRKVLKQIYKLTCQGKGVGERNGKGGRKAGVL